MTADPHKGLLSFNPAKQVPSLGIKDINDDLKCFTHRQWQIVNEVLDHMPEDTPGQRNRKERLLFCIRFAYAMGLRVTEHHDHYHSNIRYRDGWQLDIVGKGLKRRNLKLDTVDTIAFDALQRYRTYLGLSGCPAGEKLPLLPSKKPVIIKTRGPNKGTYIKDQPVTTSNWENLFKEFIRDEVMNYLYGKDTEEKTVIYESEWEHLTPHSLRHTRITHLVEIGKDVFWIQKFAGHQNINTTQKYFHIR